MCANMWNRSINRTKSTYGCGRGRGRIRAVSDWLWFWLRRRLRGFSGHSDGAGRIGGVERYLRLDYWRLDRCVSSFKTRLLWNFRDSDCTPTRIVLDCSLLRYSIDITSIIR
jgi:hypothetical protein